MAENGQLSKLVSGLGLGRDGMTALALGLLAAGQPIPAAVIGAGVLTLSIVKEIMKHKRASQQQPQPEP